MNGIVRGAAAALWALCAASAPASAATAASTAPARLLAAATGFALEGEIVEFDGASYVIAGRLGRIRAPAAEVSCEGPGCPALRGPDDPMRILAASAADMALAARLVEAAAFAAGGAAEREIGDGESLRFRLHGPDGEPAGEVGIERADPASAYAALAAGTADLVFAGRPPDAAERARPGPARGPLSAEVAARDPLALLVAPDNPLRSIRPGEAARLLSGEVADWSELGGPRAPVVVLAPEAGPAAAALAAAFAAPGPAAERVAEPRGLAERVAGDAAAIGFGGLAAAGGLRPLPLVGECGLLSAPGRFAVKAGDWPLAVERWIVAAERPPVEAALRLRDFALSPAAEPEIADLGLAGPAIEALPVAAQGDRLAGAATAARSEAERALALGFMRGVAGAERLSVGFRFEEGEAEPGPEAAAALDRLAASVAGFGPGRELLLLGFAEEGRPGAARRLSEARAERIAAALRDAFARIGATAPETSARGFGPAAPLACPGDPLNRRVEVWLR